MFFEKYILLQTLSLISCVLVCPVFFLSKHGTRSPCGEKTSTTDDTAIREEEGPDLTAEVGLRQGDQPGVRLICSGSPSVASPLKRSEGSEDTAYPAPFCVDEIRLR